MSYVSVLVWNWRQPDWAWLSLASWDISTSYFSSRPRIRAISSLCSPRSCKSETNHEHHKVEQISRSAFENWFVWTEMHESEWEFGKIGAILTWSADNAEPNGCKKPQSFQAPWKSEWFLQAVLLELSGDQSEHAGTGSLQSTCSGTI